MELHWWFLCSRPTVASWLHSLSESLIFWSRELRRVLLILTAASIKVVHDGLIWDSLVLREDIIWTNLWRSLREMTLESRWLRISNVNRRCLSETTIATSRSNVHILLAEGRSCTRRVIGLLLGLFLSATEGILVWFISISTDREIAFASRWCMNLNWSLFFIRWLIYTIVAVSHRLLRAKTIVEIFVPIYKVLGCSHLLLLILASKAHHILLLVLRLTLLKLLIRLHPIAICLRDKPIYRLVILLRHSLVLILVFGSLILISWHLVHHSVLLLLALLSCRLESARLIITPSQAELWVTSYILDLLSYKSTYQEHYEFWHWFCFQLQSNPRCSSSY